MGRIKLSEQNPIVTEDMIRETFRYKKGKRANRTVDSLKEVDLLPFTYDSENFCNFNNILSTICMAGNINYDSMNDISVSITVKPGLEPLLNEHENNFGFKYKKHGTNFDLQKGTAHLRRLALVVPGIGVTGDGKYSRTKRKSLFSSHISFLANNKKYLTGNDDKIATKVLSDLSKTCIFSKYVQDANNSFLVKLPVSKSKEIAHNRASEMLKIFNSVYPLLNMSNDDVNMYEDKKGHRTNIRFNNKRFQALQHYGVIRPIFNVCYHQFGELPYSRKGTSRNLL